MLNKIIETLKLRWWLRDQHKNLHLRRYFSSHFGIDVGYYSYGCFDRWRMPGPMRVGRYCSIANSVRTAPANHPLDSLTTHPALYERKFGVVDRDLIHNGLLVIEDDVWIGHNAVLLQGCKHVGRGAIIGAGSIVTRDVEAYTIVAGNPARKIRDRFAPDQILAIEESKWWTLDAKAMRSLLASNPDVISQPTTSNLSEWAKQIGSNDG